MIIEKQIKPYVVYYEDTIQNALQKINQNTKRVVYCISESGVLEGLVTDGDFRRWVVRVPHIDLQRPVKLRILISLLHEKLTVENISKHFFPQKLLLFPLLMVQVVSPLLPGKKVQAFVLVTD